MPSPRTIFESRRSDELRRQLFDLLGHVCANCGSEEMLEVDHPYGRNWKARKLGRYRRHLKYMKELSAGVPLRALCANCNKLIRPEPYDWGRMEMERVVPF